MAALTFMACGAGVSAVLTPYRIVVPNWKKYVVGAPLGVTWPLSVTDENVRLAVAPVVTFGLPAACAVAGSAKTATATASATLPRNVLRMDVPPSDKTFPPSANTRRGRSVRCSGRTAAPAVAQPEVGEHAEDHHRRAGERDPEDQLVMGEEGHVATGSGAARAARRRAGVRGGWVTET